MNKRDVPKIINLYLLLLQYLIQVNHFQNVPFDQKDLFEKFDRLFYTDMCQGLFKLFVKMVNKRGSLKIITCAWSQKTYWQKRTPKKLQYVKFVFSKKATKIDEIFTADLTLTTYIMSNRRWRFRHFCGFLRKHELYEKMSYLGNSVSFFLDRK